MCNEPAAQGSWGAVVWAVDASGKAPARDFFFGLDDRNAAKIQALFNRLAATGHISNNQKFKKLCLVRSRAIWEFKSFQLRFLGGFARGPRFLVAHGLRKKRNAHSREDLERAARILNDHLHREEEEHAL